MNNLSGQTYEAIADLNVSANQRTEDVDTVDLWYPVWIGMRPIRNLLAQTQYLYNSQLEEAENG